MFLFFFPFCGEGELVGGVHTLVGRVVQVYQRLQVHEEEEKAVSRAGSRKGESRAKRDAHEDDHVDEVNGANILSLSHSACVCG